MKKILTSQFFDRKPQVVAKELLGKYLVRSINGKEVASMITETEAYDGERDLACHAAKGRTPRTEVMYGPPGCFYVYLVYGMHYLLNVVTREKNYPSAVLIRSLEDISGPARLTKYLKIDLLLNKKPAQKSAGLWFEDRGGQLSIRIVRTPRIGVAYAQCG